MSEEQNGRRWWAWGRRGGSGSRWRYDLKEAYSEENVSLYQPEPTPEVKKTSTSDDHLLDREDDDEGEDEDEEEEEDDDDKRRGNGQGQVRRFPSRSRRHHHRRNRRLRTRREHNLNQHPFFQFYDREAIRPHYDDDYGPFVQSFEEEEDEEGRRVEEEGISEMEEEEDVSENLWETLAYKGDSQDSEEGETDEKGLFESETEVENLESETEDNKKKVGGAVQTIVERLRACGLRHGRTVDPEWVASDAHSWTSLDLRKFLLNKAQLEWGGPYDANGNERYEMKTCDDPTTERVSNANYRRLSPASTPSTPPSPPHHPTFPGATRPRGPRRGIARRARGTVASMLRGRFSPRMGAPRGSVQLEHMITHQRNLSPEPRPRLWSLPAIIVTTSEDPTLPSPPGARHGLSDSMNYLKVPDIHSFRHRQEDSRPTASQNGPASITRGIDPAEEEKTVISGLASATKLGSIMDLWRGNWQVEEEETTDKDGRMYPRGSPPPDPRPQAAPEYLIYEESFMYGRYSANLAEYARQEAKRLRDEEQNKDEVLFSKELQPYRGRIARTCISFIRPIWDHTFARLGEDWVFLFILGTVMATISFSIDAIVLVCFGGRMYLQTFLGTIHWGLQLFCWVTVPTLLVIFSAAFCQWMAPSAAGSGIPEMKTVLRGVVLKEYLTWKTLVAKMVSLAAVIGSGLPLGKEGPVMHMASIVATMLTKLLRFVKGTVENDARSTDLLAAACTMGVAVSYAAPIGGVLFSIEVTTVYFAVRNYWRGFFAAVVGAMFYRLMSVWFMGAKTISPLYKVELNYAYPYDVVELLPFLCIGIMCGFAGSLFVYLHRRYVMFMRQNKTLKNFLQKKRLLYPTFVAIIFSTMTFPMFLGQFMAATVPTSVQIMHLFSNVTWTKTGDANMLSKAQENILKDWMPDVEGSFHLSLFVFQIVTVFQIAVSSTLPLPSGMLIPLFKVGAAFGRQIGELMVSLYPEGLATGALIVPGAYAMVGAASFCAAITHTISISVIVFELTGQITYVIPIMIGVLIANCISSLLQPSIYDSMIRIKKLPYLPDIIATTSADVYNIYVEDIMVRDVQYIWYGITYVELKKVLKENRKLKYLPLVDKPDSMILLGSIQRIELVRVLVQQISSEKRHKEATRRHLEALRKRWEEEDAGDFKQSRIRYEDEVNEDSGDSSSTPGLIHRFSRSLSRSFSRSRSASRSRSRSRSVSRSRQGTPSRRDSLTPPSSPGANRLKELFPSKSPLARKPSRFSITKVENGGSKTEEDSEGKSTTPEKGKKGGKSRKKHSSGKEKDPVKELRRRATLKRSNSLDSSGFRTAGQEGDSTTDGKEEKDTKAPESVTSPKKGILKRRNSFSLGSTTTPVASPPETPYQTITVGDTKDETSTGDERPTCDISEEETTIEVTIDDSRRSHEIRLRSAFEKVRKMKMETASSMEFKLSQISLFKSKKKENAKKPILDLTEEERAVWELSELSKEVDFTKCHIDPAPFQLVERTSLLRVHSMFSMLGINHAYVTAIGRLIGVVALKELRNAIDGQYVGQPHRTVTPQVSAPNTPMSPMNSSAASSSSPQRLSSLSPIHYSDPEAGTISQRGSRTHLLNYPNSSSHS
ncbi:chloride channel protein 2-like isoform X2 [Macrobrachium rosenbergii]|uniref:chloride channel protein 2-like isoform X2 n=1 Tax=Macrobrachium rosenbergii TaxID=79674 RepID=UPI0034D477C7